MPLLKRKAIKPVPPPSIKDFEEGTQVFVMRFTNEIFTTYEDYINRYLFYRQKTWQCETTGKSGLTYEQALESEHKEKSMVANKFPPQLRKPLLEFVQFQTARVDSVVDDAFARFKNHYFENEPVNVAWDDLTYSAFVRKVLPKEEWIKIEGGESEVSGQYLVQVLDERGNGIQDMERIVDCSSLSRDRLAFNKNIIRKYIRECSTKESYIGAPWIVKPALSSKYGISTNMPAHLQEARETALSKSKKRKDQTDPAPELASSKKAKKDAADKAKEEGAEVVLDAKAAIKYPIEDLDVVIPKDTETVVVRPTAMTDISVPQDCFEAVIMSWQFLNSFSSPLKLTPFGIKDFEDSLAHTTIEPRSVMVAEYHSTLMNVIIQDRMKGIVKPVLAPTGSAATYTRDERENSVMTEGSNVDDGELSIDGQDEYVQQGRRNIQHRPINEQVIVVGQGWDLKLIPPSREGWEAVLVGLLNELGSFEAIPNVDRILNHLVPDEKSSKEDVEYLFPLLPLEDKISVLVFLVEAAAGTSSVRRYMDECREQLKELRLEKFELNKERRRLQVEKAEMERQDLLESKNAVAAQQEEGQEQNTPNEQSVEPESDAEAKALAMSRSESRQEKLKRQQLEREMEEQRRTLDIQRQRALSKAKTAELKVRHDARRKLADQEHALNRKEDQVDQDTRRCLIARVKPLGRDRFFNRYWYFDGMTTNHATDRVYVQSPSFLDLETVRSRADREAILARQRVEDPSGGLESWLRTHEEDVSAGSAAEKAAREKKALLEKEREMDSEDDSKPVEGSKANGTHAKVEATDLHLDETMSVEQKSSHWSYYSEPEQIDSLLKWFNNKGVREHALIASLEKQYDQIVRGMQLRHQDLVNSLQKENSRRSTRTRTVQATEGFLGYVNRASK